MIKDTKTRTNISIDKEFKKQLQELAEQESRSFNSLVIAALRKYYEEMKANDCKA